jgi:hypothetical protein
MGPTKEAVFDLKKKEAMKRENPSVALLNKPTKANMYPREENTRMLKWIMSERKADAKRNTMQATRIHELM